MRIPLKRESSCIEEYSLSDSSEHFQLPGQQFAREPLFDSPDSLSTTVDKVHSSSDYVAAARLTSGRALSEQPGPPLGAAAGSSYKAFRAETRRFRLRIIRYQSMEN
ncbi:hypothetical protein MRX96_050544 [Rhipicephalus microplus]